MRNIAPKLCVLLRKPKHGKIFVNQKLKLHNGMPVILIIMQKFWYIHLLHFLSLTKRYEKKELIFKKKKKMIDNVLIKIYFFLLPFVTFAQQFQGYWFLLSHFHLPINWDYDIVLGWTLFFLEFYHHLTRVSQNLHSFSLLDKIQ